MNNPEWWEVWGYDTKPRCANCGEWITLQDQQYGEVAEVYNPSQPDEDSKLVHWGCRYPGEEMA